MANPGYVASGTLVIPMEVFNAWALTYLPLGANYELSKVKDKGEYLEVPYTASTPNVPPAYASQAPAPVPEEPA